MTPAFVPRFRLVGLEGLYAQVSAAARAKVRKLSTVEVLVVAGSGDRTADENTVIAKVQAKQDRNPFYLTREQVAEVRNTLSRTLVRRGGDGNPEIDDRALKAVGERMLEYVRANVAAQRNPNGRGFRPLTPAYAKAKRSAVGFERPILRRTGELIDGLRIVVRRPGS